jgi:hypothetical protein
MIEGPDWRAHRSSKLKAYSFERLIRALLERAVAAGAIGSAY